MQRLTPGGAAAACCLAVPFIAAAGFASALVARPAGASAPADAALVALDVLTHAAVLAVPLVLAAWAVLALSRLGTFAAGLLAGCVLAAAAIAVNADNLRGPKVLAHEHRALIVGGLQAALGAAVLCGTMLVAWVVRQEKAGLRRAAGLVLVLAAAGAVVADRRVLPGLYPALHLELLAAALLSATAGFALWVRALPARAQGRLGAAAGLLLLAVAGAGIWQRTRPAYARVAAHTPAHAGPLGQALPLTERVLALAVPRPAPQAGSTAAFAAMLDGVESRAAERELLARTLPATRDWNLVLVSVDTVRADAVGYGGGAFAAKAGRSLTPAIDRVAESSVVFERAYTSYPTSAWAYASMLSGLHPRVTPTAAATFGLDIPFPDDTYLHRIFAARGWVCAAVTSFPSFWLGVPELMGRLKEGFEPFIAAETIEEARGERIVDEALRVVDGFGGRRFFLWVVLLDAHEPYDGPPPEGLADDAVGRYLGDVARADREVGRLLDGLQSRGLLDRSIVAIHSDHGEEFGEHGSFAHNSNLYEPQARVPFLMRVPGAPARRVPDTVSLADFLPTVLSVLGIDDGMVRTGRSIAPLLVGGRAGQGGIAYAEQIAFARGSVPRRAVWLGSLKLIRRVDFPALEVFDVAADPGERDNLLGKDPERDARLLGLMAAWDERIDGRWTALGGRSPEALERFRERAHALAGRIAAADGDAPALFRELNASLVTPYLAIRPEAREALGDAGLAEVVRRLVPAAATLDRTMFACLLGATGLPEARAWLEERWKAAPAEHAQLAYGLAWLGDDAARAFFKPIFEDPTTLRPDLIAVPLARTGDAAGEAFLLEAVRAGRDDLLGVALPAAARIGSPALRRAIARRIRAETDLPEAVLVLAIEALRADASENATETLAGLASSRWPSVAGAARSALATRLPAAAVEAEIAASKLEAEGARALRALRAEEAAAMFARCVAASSLPRVEARLLAATALRLSGKAADAGRVAAEAESAAKEPADRRRAALARRCVSDPVIVPASAIGARVQVLEKPAKTVADQSIRVRLAITNDGSACWPGGPGPFAFWIDFACLDADGKRREAPESFPYGIHWLPEEGVLPGETVTVEFVDTVPAPAASDRFVLTLRQLDGAPEGQVLASW